MDNLFKIESMEEFSCVTKEILSNLYFSHYNSSINIAPSILQSVKEDIKDTIVKCNFDIYKVKEILEKNPWQSDKLNNFTSLLEEKQSEILYFALNHYNSFQGETINNFDWILKIVLGTNELKSLKLPLLQLIFSTSNNKGEVTRTSYDLTKEAVLKMINVLEDINANDVKF